MDRMEWKAATVKKLTSETGSRAAAPSGVRGFTLLELALVLVVMSLVAVLTYPALLRGRTAFHLRAVGRDVIGSLRFARETAVTEQKVMMVQVDSQAQKLTVSDDVGDGARSLALPGDVRLELASSSGVAIPDGQLLIRFLPNGSADDAQFLLRSNTGATLKVVTDAITGVARALAATEERLP
jgi:general secretion pathway protein H